MDNYLQLFDINLEKNQEQEMAKSLFFAIGFTDKVLANFPMFSKETQNIIEFIVKECLSND